MPSIQKTIGGKRRTLDARPDRVDFRDRIYQPKLRNLPDQWPSKELVKDYYPAFSTLVLNQGEEGACTGFGLAAMIHYLRFKDYVLELPSPKAIKQKDLNSCLVSTRMLYEMARLYDEWQGEDYEGSSCRGAMKGWHRHGVCSDSFWPYVADGSIRPSKGWEVDAAKAPLGAYYRINRESITDMQSAIREVGAIYASATVHSGWNLSRAKEIQGIPIIPMKREPTGGHAFAIVGYNRDGFIVQNSWGHTWGYHGFAVLGYEDWVRNGSDAWVAALGAPMSVKKSRSHVTLEGGSRSASLWGGFSSDDIGNCDNTHPGIWSEDVAYSHSLVIENEGRAHRNRFENANAAEQVEDELFANAERWMKSSSKLRDIAVFVHGGLNSEKAAIERARKLGPYFLANDVYPIFIVWKTGVFESLFSMGDDLIDLILRRDKDSSPVMGPKDWISSAWDRTAEVTLRPLGLGLWSEMKENAASSAKPGHGADLLSAGLQNLAKSIPNAQIHLVGHSAGSIWLGYLLDVLRSSPGGATKVNSCHLYAAACTVEFANQHYIPAVQDGTISARRFFHSYLSDKAERNDTVIQIYRKSLLYFVSRACERKHKTPILGMEATWNSSFDKKNIFKEEFSEDWKEWRKFVEANPLPKPRVVGPKEIVETGCKAEEPTHGGFDNDLEQITDTLKRIRRNQSTLPEPVLCLGDC